MGGLVAGGGGVGFASASGSAFSMVRPCAVLHGISEGLHSPTETAATRPPEVQLVAVRGEATDHKVELFENAGRPADNESEPEPDYTSLLEDYKTGQIPLAWQWTARHLIASANLLHQERQTRRKEAVRSSAKRLFFDSHASILLLYGLALENLLKALLVAQGVEATSTGALNAKLKTHNVLMLWRWAGLPLDPQREDLLRRLHWSIEAGKYPVGVKLDQRIPHPCGSHSLASGT